MIITLSPAKLLDFTSKASTDLQTEPLFIDRANELNDILQNFSSTEIVKLMKVNPKQALEVYQYIQAFDMDLTPQKQAALAYNGIAFGGLDANSFSESDWLFAQEHLIILSGLYGALRPLDKIKPYRLDLMIKLEVGTGKDLYEYWKECLTNYFSERLNADNNTWLNLSSNEYSKVIDKKKLPKGYKIITPIFKEDTPQGCKQVVVYAKRARGMMSKFIIQNKITEVDDIKSFDTEGYNYNPSLSDDKEWVFTR